MAVSKLVALAQASDPKKEILAQIGDLSNVAVMSGRVLVWIYVAPEKTSGGIIRPQSNIKEDVYQGQVGLVLKKGPMAFKDDDHNSFHGQSIEEGDWVAFRPGDGKRIQIRGVDCRIIEDVMIDLVVADPAVITYAR